MASETPAVIRDFLKEYDSSLYNQLAEAVEKLCEPITDSIQAILTHRGKEKKSLEKKLMERHPSKHYSQPKDIRADIIDLAGVRIALYMPQHKAQVDYLIRTTFEIQDFVNHPDDSEQPILPSDKRYPGYQATHYRVRLLQNQLEGLTESVRNLKEPVVEIQVVTILHHVWANVQHDIEYKTLGGSPSKDELRMLDLLNGLMQLGESHLEALHDINIERIKSQNKVFASKWELGSWLSSWLSRQMKPEDVNLGPIEVLRRFISLRSVSKDTPNKLESVLEDMKLGVASVPSVGEISRNLGNDESRASILIIAHIIRKDFPRHRNSQQALAIDKSNFSHKDKLMVMASSFVWLHELFPQASRWAHLLMQDAIAKNKKDAVKWLLTTTRARLMMTRNDPPPDREYTDALWNWMESSPIEILCLALSISKLGVYRQFPKEDEFAKLKAVYGVLERFL